MAGPSTPGPPGAVHPDIVHPKIDPSAVLSPGCVIVGQVTVEADCFIGPNAVLRGDIEPILVRAGANVQDNCVVHTERGHPATIGRDVSVGHGAIVHGATIDERALVGMGAVVLNGARVGERAVLGALTLVPEGFTVPPRSLAVGIPCRIVREDDERVARMAFDNASRYHGYREAHRAGQWGIVRGGQDGHEGGSARRAPGRRGDAA